MSQIKRFDGAAWPQVYQIRALMCCCRSPLCMMLVEVILPEVRIQDREGCGRYIGTNID
jgi:hypothetical protein